MISTLIIMTGLMAGVYFTFSAFIMKTLAQLPSREGADVMIKINELILKSLFLPLFFASSILHAMLIAWFFFADEDTNSICLLFSGAIYLTGMFLVTVVGNVPLNKKLKASAEVPSLLEEVWQKYLQSWTSLNHIRTLSCSAALFCLVIGS